MVAEFPWWRKVAALPVHGRGETMNTPEDSKKVRENSHQRGFDAASVPTAGE